MRSKNDKCVTLIIIILAMIIAGLLAVSYMHFWGTDINVPLTGYRSDSIGMLLETNNYMRGGNVHKTVINRAPYNERYVGTLVDFTLIIPVNALLGRIFGSAEAGINMHAVLAGMLCAGCMCFVSLKLNIKKCSAIIVSVLYSCIPFFSLASNTVLIAYWICFYIPLFAYCIIIVMSEDSDLNNLLSTYKNRKVFFVFYIITMFLVGIYSAYYAFFALFILIFAGAYALIANKSLSGTMMSIVGLIVVTIGIAIYIMPNILNKLGMTFIWEKGLYYPGCLIVILLLFGFEYLFWKKVYSHMTYKTIYIILAILIPLSGIAYLFLKKFTNFIGEYDGRTLFAVEKGSYKISHVILPVYSNVCDAINQEMEYFACIAQDEYTMLGILTGIGFIYSLLRLVNLNKKEDIRDKIVGLCGICNAFIMLLSIRGGLSSIIAALVTTGIRNYNRICVYLAVFSLISFGIMFDKILERISIITNGKKKTILYILTDIVCGVSVIISIPVDSLYGNNYELVSYEQRKAEHDEWVDFIGKIEDLAPDNGMILELPLRIDDIYSAELMTKGRLYELSVPAIVSSSTVWSFAGGWKPDTDLEEDASAFIMETHNAGFCGIYVDTLLYENGKEKNTLELLEKYLGEPIECNDNRRYYFSIAK